MERIGRNRFLNVDNCLRNHGMKSLESDDQLNHLECYYGLKFVFTS